MLFQLGLPSLCFEQVVLLFGLGLGKAHQVYKMVRLQKLAILLKREKSFLPLGKLLGSDGAVNFCHRLDDFLEL